MYICCMIQHIIILSRQAAIPAPNTHSTRVTPKLVLINERRPKKGRLKPQKIDDGPAKITEHPLPLTSSPNDVVLHHAAKHRAGPILQRAAKPNFPLTKNTLSQTLPAFGTRCQPRRCSRNSRWTSVVSSKQSNPIHRVSLSLRHSIRCHPLWSEERFPN